MTDHFQSIIPPLIIAQASAAAAESPWFGLTTFGPLGLWVMWMLYRDKRESDKTDLRHQEHMDQQKKIEKSFQRCITAITVTMEGMKSMDRAYLELAAKLNTKHDDETTDSR